MRLVVSARIAYRIVLHNARTEQFVHPVGAASEGLGVGKLGVGRAPAVNHHLVAESGILGRI